MGGIPSICTSNPLFFCLAHTCVVFQKFMVTPALLSRPKVATFSAILQHIKTCCHTLECCNTMLPAATPCNNDLSLAPPLRSALLVSLIHSAFSCSLKNRERSACFESKSLIKYILVRRADTHTILALRSEWQLCSTRQLLSARQLRLSWQLCTAR